MAAGTESDAGAADNPVSSYWQKYVVDGYKLKKDSLVSKELDESF